MKNYKDNTLAEYLEALAKKEPVPGGGSASALAGALAAALIGMVAGYSVGKGKTARIENKIKKILEDSEKIRLRFLELVDLDAQAYLYVVASKNKPANEKKQADRNARKVMRENCRLCYKAIFLSEYLAKHGNQYLIGDVEVAGVLLEASFNGAMALIRE